MSLRVIACNRTQKLVVAFFLTAWAGAITILVASPQVYARTLRRAPGGLRAGEAVFVVVVTALIGVICYGVVRRWRWIFWLILGAFLLAVLRLPVTVFELAGHAAAGSPTWYVLVQAAAATLQFAIALAMLAGYRRSGVWGSF